MMLVTTSRRSTPFIRTLARDLAFATGSRYLPRGKHGFREIAEENDLFIVIDQQSHSITLTAYLENNPVISRIIKDHEEGMRERKIMRGIETSDERLKDVLMAFCEVNFADSEEKFISFDGPQKRWMKLIFSEDSICAA